MAPSATHAPTRAVRFAHTGDGVRLAYTIDGDGPGVIVKVGMWLTHLEFDATNPLQRHWLDAMRTRGRYIRYDARGCGLSDPSPNEIGFERWVDDLETVTLTVTDEPITVLGFSQGAAIAVAYAARQPERVSRLILHGGFARGRLARARTADERAEAETMCQLAEQGWAKEDGAYRQFFTTQILPAATPQQQQWFNELQRISASPAIAARYMRVFNTIDVTTLLPHVQCPTLVLHSKDDVRVPFDEGRLLATSIPNAQLVPIDGSNHALMGDEPGWEQAVRAIDAFLPVRGHPSSPGFVGHLTPRQLEILELIAQGCANAEIAERLHLADKTVRNQVSAIFDEMAVTSRSQAIVRARDAGYGRSGAQST
jgi:pimeloyl-ACP methyl ester carboxylesterase/DNA-binding CsgD family transcriptional regulator